jgi:hypothetical protein
MSELTTFGVFKKYGITIINPNIVSSTGIRPIELR